MGPKSFSESVHLRTRSPGSASNSHFVFKIGNKSQTQDYFAPNAASVHPNIPNLNQTLDSFSPYIGSIHPNISNLNQTQKNSTIPTNLTLNDPIKVPTLCDWISAELDPNYTSNLLSGWLSPGGVACNYSKTADISIPGLDSESHIELSTGDIHEFVFQALDEAGKPNCDRFLREKNFNVVIRDERELNQIRMHGVKKMLLLKWHLMIMLDQRPNAYDVNEREQENTFNRGGPHPFRLLTPSRRRRACLEGGMTSTSIEIPTNSPNRAMVSHAFKSSSVVVLPKTPNLRDYSASTRTPHIKESVAMLSIAMDEPEMCHSSMPPRNLEEEFLAVATAHAPHAQLLDKELLTMPGTSLAPIHQ
ncbi:hypothetical protein RHSIM_RhsimUnG0214000 [Rhododendron simsii]|uniref:Uncharacterized protein n=1 Tax=Rhododendron simsii TaxID=118357 RepID=A0A834L3I0_RHOSS|nr:hypothetical protein RHSIM_RhsimUnG0214000 [Rhododendron simsii]